MTSRRLFLQATASSAWLIPATGAIAQPEPSFPTRPVSLVVPYTTGGAADALARSLADVLRARWGQAVIVENKPGAGGVIANEFVARAAPDGYTLLLGGSSMTMLPAISKQAAKLSPVSDFTQIAELLSLELYIMVSSDLPINNLQELIAYAKARPGKLSYASVGTGSITHMQMELLQSMTGLHVLHIPYRGTAPALTDFLAGQVQITIDSMATAGQYVRMGRARPIAVLMPTRTAHLPGVPTIKEAGLQDYDATAWTGIMGPAGMPAALVERLSRDIVAAAQDGAFQKRAEAIGARVSTAGPQKYADRVRTDTVKWARLVKERQLQTDR